MLSNSILILIKMSKIVDIERLCRLCLDISEQKIILDEMNDDKLMAKIENYTSLKVK